MKSLQHPTIFLEEKIHRKNNQLLIKFEYDETLISLVRTVTKIHNLSLERLQSSFDKLLNGRNMRRILLLLVCMICFHWSSYSQCPHNPTITPMNPILCPNESDTLWTQSYDSYQWYKDGNLLPGETNQYLVVDATNYGLSNITVEATDAGCSELSPSVIFDNP